MQQVLNLSDLEIIERVHARGGKFRYYPLLSGKDGTAGNFFLQLSYTYSDFDSPRHRHNFDQVRVQLEGDADFSRDGVMKPGMVGYFPEGVFYGPQSIPGESITLVLQFGGASRSGYLSEAEFQRGIAELKETGTFERGVYKVAKPEGGTRNQDAYEAVWEHMNQRELRYPESRYDKPVFMRPDAAAWIPDPTARGVARKHLGTYSEAHTRLSQLALDAGAELPVPPNTIVFVLQGSGSTASGHWQARSSLYSGDGPSSMHAEHATQLIQIELPRL
ncbi:hypothetical protein H4CHR_01657 [Variovorax sp. PBS-H4]|uniref:hypothetical protein n=1 Tax=Variovorax sp. PBS-H4 TaxID=434008 RepID=UPI0013197EAA|nr:hypothetical protein [Variovorax sp. PBS-H4]VTU25755.1 hypothetical protein H4CHR_01657 [Variovorax sp. PBS-H4]